MNQDVDMNTLNEDFKYTVTILGKKKKLGRTNLNIRIYFKKLMNDIDSVHTIGSPEVFQKRFDEISSELRKLVKQIISPLTKSELEELDIEDYEQIGLLLTRRTLLARGYTAKQILDMEDAEREMAINAMTEGLGNFPKPPTDEEKLGLE